MAVQTTVLFGRPQTEIASDIAQRMAQATETHIVTGFLTPGGLESIAPPIYSRPQSLATFVVGAATYPAFEAMDDLIAAGVPADRLHVHLGHSRLSGTRKHPIVRYHPMLHSKIYFMELPERKACAFIGSHNVTSFALDGKNGEASVRFEGDANSTEFDTVRRHIAAAKAEAVAYSPSLKDGLAWWTREFLDGLKAEMKIPSDWVTVRTLLVFAQSPLGGLPKSGDEFYFEIPAGIEQIESLKTETHLFLFRSLPADPWEALNRATNAEASFTCKTLGADNKRGNREVAADWQIDNNRTPVFTAVPGGVYRPSVATGMQQVRAEIDHRSVLPYEYGFDREKAGWEPVFADDAKTQLANPVRREYPDGGKSEGPWLLVRSLKPRSLQQPEKDEMALKEAAPESGSFLLVSLRRRRKDRIYHEE